jgi:sulfatase maturation enzyme AslB (radical SAM superfamily)
VSEHPLAALLDVLLERRFGDKLEAAIATERERCARICEEMAQRARAANEESAADLTEYCEAYEHAARRIREEPAK